jgi:ABC-type branched-subunit amino acid transport system substrate-binding protein
MNTSARHITALCLLLLAAACGGPKAEEPATEPGAADEPSAAEPALKTDKGVNLATKTIRLGVLNDESGPAATIGKPYAVGKRILAAQINAGGSSLLPEGWKVELVEKDHGYNPQKSVQAYNQVKDDVLLVAHSFGTPNTMPLRPMLERDTMLALPASLSSQMQEHKSTPPAGPSYEIEAMRAMDWVVAEVEKAGKKKEDVKAAVVYQQDDYGQDGLNGWKKAAEHHGVKVVSEQTVTPGQRDFAAIVSSLKGAGATHVMLTVLPSATGPLLGTAATHQFKPTWIGQSPSWIDGFFNPEVIPSAVFATYHWVTGFTFWGEDVPGMPNFLDAYEKHGKAQAAPDYYILLSYAQGVLAIEFIKRAIEAGDVTRAGVMAQVPKVSGFDANGLFQPLDLTAFPYVTSTRARVMTPDFAKKSWTMVGEYATPAALGGAAEGGKTAAVGAPPAAQPVAAQ